MVSCWVGESASWVPAGRFWATAEVASRSAEAVRLRENFCIRWLDPLPPSNVCKVFQKKDLGVDFSVHLKYRSPELDDRASRESLYRYHNRPCQAETVHRLWERCRDRRPETSALPFCEPPPRRLQTRALAPPRGLRRLRAWRRDRCSGISRIRISCSTSCIGHGTRMSERQRYVEVCTARLVVLRPDPSAMGFNNGARHSQTYTHAFHFCRHKGVKDSFRILDSGPVIDHLDQHSV